MPNPQTILRIVSFLAVAVAASSMIFTLFMLGHTETYSPEATTLSTAISAAAALTAGFLWWLGEPARKAAPPTSGRASRRRKKS